MVTPLLNIFTGLVKRFSQTNAPVRAGGSGNQVIRAGGGGGQVMPSAGGSQVILLRLLVN